MKVKLNEKCKVSFKAKMLLGFLPLLTNTWGYL